MNSPVHQLCFSPPVVDCLELCAGGEVDSMERKPFQSNVPQTSQEALSKVSLKEELPDDPSEEVNDADQHVVGKQIRPYRLQRFLVLFYFRMQQLSNLYLCFTLHLSLLLFCLK